MVTDQKKHELFANGLALILPSFQPHALDPSDNITPGVIELARNGGYALLEFDGPTKALPLCFEVKEYWLHLRPAIRELWLACYRSGNE
jgi:hypothetical protein